MTLEQWAIRHHVGLDALAELRVMMTPPSDPPAPAGTSEAAISNLVRLEASRKGCRLWRNNIGAGYLQDGSFIRWGLANDSATINARLKSADLIGIRPVLVEPRHLGSTIGQFVSREVKAAGWKYRGTDREIAQMRWAGMIAGFGGDAAIVNGEGTI
jgi:hypothetical protein